ncbi:MAG: hypothetical protein JO019_00990 [Candidatus Kaiserbacteria bacterium]|nr:hypothetical protein [Candidatus Kaiserbacteria bacterium]
MSEYKDIPITFGRVAKALTLVALLAVIALLLRPNSNQNAITIVLLVFGCWSVWYGAMVLLKKDFSVNWYADNARLKAQAENVAFNEAAEKQLLRRPTWKYYFRADGIGSLLLGAYFLWVVIKTLI